MTHFGSFKQQETQVLCWQVTFLKWNNVKRKTYYLVELHIIHVPTKTTRLWCGKLLPHFKASQGKKGAEQLFYFKRCFGCSGSVWTLNRDRVSHCLVWIHRPEPKHSQTGERLCSSVWQMLLYYIVPKVSRQIKTNFQGLYHVRSILFID